MKKRLMILGGSRYIIPVIKKAHELGIYVITADYLPDNDAHKYADKYVDVSVIDKDEVLRVAKELEIDGIISFACDPGVVSAAYVAEEMGLPFQCGYKSACILQDKGLFRKFLTDHSFNCPRSKRYDNKDEALKEYEFFDFPIMVKPTDSAGSKGVNKVDGYENMEAAIDEAIKVSHNGAFIIEEYLDFEGHHSSSDSFTIDGKLVFNTYSDQLFDPEASNPYTPAYIIWPSTMKDKYQDELTKEIQRLMDLLNMKTGIYNIETCVSDGKPYIMEVSPRGGGCKIAELLESAYGVELIEGEVRKAVGMELNDIHQNGCDGTWCEMVVHARAGESGVLKDIRFERQVDEKYIKVKDISATVGDYVHPFTGANMALGDLFLKFDSREELDSVTRKQKEWLTIEME